MKIIIQVPFLVYCNDTDGFYTSVYNVLSISRLSIAEMKYLLKISAHLVWFLMISSSSKSKIFPFLGDFSEKWFYLFPKLFIIRY